MKNNQRRHIQSGFTFIELLLYISIVTIVLMALVPFAWTIIGAGTQSANQQEVFSQARYISERIKYEIRNASGINSISASSISLSNSVSAQNPTVIDLSAGKVRITQGASSPVVIQSTDTTTTALTFTTYTSVDNKTKHIGFTITVDDNFNSSRQEFQIPAMTLRSSAEIRSN